MSRRPILTCGDNEKASAAFCLAFFTRRVFSALVDGDFVATEEFAAGRTVARGFADITLADLKRRLDDFLAAKGERARWEQPGPLNDARAAILASARASGLRKPTIDGGARDARIPTVRYVEPRGAI